MEDAKHALRAVVPDLDERIRQGQIEFLDYRQWYFPDGEFDAESLLQRCVEKERTALAQGYEGIRLTGNVPGSGQADGTPSLITKRRSMM